MEYLPNRGGTKSCFSSCNVLQNVWQTTSQSPVNGNLYIPVHLLGVGKDGEGREESGEGGGSGGIGEESGWLDGGEEGGLM